MSTNGGAECWNTTMVVFVDIGFIYVFIYSKLKPKIQCIG